MHPFSDEKISQNNLLSLKSQATWKSISYSYLPSKEFNVYNYLTEINY